MKKLILVITVISFIVNSASAAVCTKDGKLIEFYVSAPASDNYSANIYINQTENNIIFFEDILKKSGTCFSPSSLYTGAQSPFGEDLICKGELFAPAIYGQIVITKGAVAVLINEIAPASGWDCRL